MKFGIVFPNSFAGLYGNVPFAGPEQLVHFAQMVDRLGYDSMWGLDLMLPGTSRRAAVQEESPDWYELMVSLAYAASRTKRIKLATGVIILPLREPVLLAKQACTLDQFSHGRTILGVGIGASKNEFESLQPRLKGTNRGAMLEDSLNALKLLLKGQPASYKGKFYEFNDVDISPRPFNGKLPVYIAGNTDQQPDVIASRVARWADGWLMSVATNAETIRERVERIRPMLEKEGRKPSDVDYAAVTIMSIAKDSNTALDRFLNTRVTRRRRGGQTVEQLTSKNLIGTVNEVIEKVAGFKKEGATSCIITNPAVDTLQEMVEQTQWFAEEVMPHFS